MKLPPITIKQLIARLTGVPDNFLIQLEGCDCQGLCCDVSIGEGEITLLREYDPEENERQREQRLREQTQHQMEMLRHKSIIGKAGV